MGFRFGIDQLCLFGLNPVEHVRLAADLECGWVSMAARPMQPNLDNHPPFDLATDAVLRREVKAALADTGIVLGCGEGFMVPREGNVETHAAGLDAMAELGCERINVMSVERDPARAEAQLHTLMAMVEMRGMGIMVEYVPGLFFSELKQTLARLDAMGRPEVPVVVDTMHLFCGGGSAADIAAMDKSRLAYVQLCDRPVQAVDASYYADSVDQRYAPGDGVFPFVDLLKIVPDGITLSFEVPEKAKIAAGVPIRERMVHCLDATRRLLAEAGRA